LAFLGAAVWGDLANSLIALGNAIKARLAAAQTVNVDHFARPRAMTRSNQPNLDTQILKFTSAWRGLGGSLCYALRS
jgi:hypothetical protein